MELVEASGVYVEAVDVKREAADEIRHRRHHEREPETDQWEDGVHSEAQQRGGGEGVEGEAEELGPQAQQVEEEVAEEAVEGQVELQPDGDPHQPVDEAFNLKFFIIWYLTW